DATPEDLGARL
nr:Chain C, PEP-4 [synthetic construct]